MVVKPALEVEAGVVEVEVEVEVEVLLSLLALPASNSA